MSELMRVVWKRIVLDEGHVMGSGTDSNKALMCAGIHTRSRLGPPVQAQNPTILSCFERIQAPCLFMSCIPRYMRYIFWRVLTCRF